MASGLESFIGLYPVNKTLRFELIPQGETQKWIEKNGILERDNMLAEDYQLMKTFIDEYHRNFISTILSNSNIDIDWTELADAIDMFQAADAETRDAARTEMVKAQSRYRQLLVSLLKDPENHGLAEHPGFSFLFNADFIKTILPVYFANEKDKFDVISKFENFTTYFYGFFDNRKHLYTSEEKVGSIGYRTVNQNFPTFYQNIKTYSTLKKVCPELLVACEKELEGVFGEFGMENVFELDFFNRVLSQDGIDFYNTVFGGVAKEEGRNVRGLNQYLNEAIQQGKLDERFRRVRFAPLYKQILTKSETLSFVLDKIENDNEATSMVVDLFDELGVNKIVENDVLYRFANAIRTDKFNMKKIYVRNSSLSRLSAVLTGEGKHISNALAYCEANFCGPAEGMKKAQAAKWHSQQQFSLDEIRSACVAANIFIPEDILDIVSEETLMRLQEARGACDEARKPCAVYTSNKRLLLEDEAEFEPIKYALELLLKCNDMINMFTVERALDRDAGFYALHDEVREYANHIVHVHNKLRNYITQNPYSEEKFKLNFDIRTLAAGWDINKESQNRCTILLKDGRYYLGIIDKNAKNPFDKAPMAEGSKTCYQKMVYKLLPGPNKMLPKCFFSNKGKELFNPSDYILDGYAAGKHLKGDNFDLQFCHDLIDFFKDSINDYPDWEVFEFNFSDTSTYKNISDFYKEVTRGGYSIKFVDIPTSYVDELVADGKLYLFQIYNKDFSELSHGRKSLHTLYFENLFNPENLKNVVFKLDGKAELFYRPASISKPYVHRVGEKLVNKTYKENGVILHIPDDIYMQIFNHVNGKLDRSKMSSEAKALLDSGRVVIKDVKHDIVKDKRYTQDKYSFYVPMTINYGSQGLSNINYKALEYLHCNPEVNIIGIDRGERNLIYATVINQKGEILEQRSFNVINGIDYRAKLDAKEHERMSSRRNWKRIDQIAQIKEGYLSLVVPEIAKMMVRHNAIVALEDLNVDFKNSRVRIEKQVYQKFEKALVEKLNYFAQKPPAEDGKDGVNEYEAGGIARGYQLANKFEGFESMRRQSGFIFYVSPWNTSNLDPTTGFCNLFNRSLLSYTNIEISKEFFGNFNRITYSPVDDYFEFEFAYSRFKQIKRHDYTDVWTVCSNGSRIIKHKNTKTGEWSTSVINLTDELKTLFNEAGIDYEFGGDIRNDICLMFDKAKFTKLFELFSAIVQIRNSSLKSNDDYILSPVKNTSGFFYDSRHVNASKLPVDGDANDAFNIARKALKLLREFNETEPVKGVYKLPSLAKGENERWLEWAQTHTV